MKFLAGGLDGAAAGIGNGGLIEKPEVGFKRSGIIRLGLAHPAKEVGILHCGTVSALRRGSIGWREDVDLTEKRLAGGICERAVAIAAPSGLDNGIVRTERTPDGGEIHVHPSLDALGGDEQARLLLVQPLCDFSENLEAVRRIHPGG